MATIHVYEQTGGKVKLKITPTLVPLLNMIIFKYLIKDLLLYIKHELVEKILAYVEDLYVNKGEINFLM